MRVDKCIPLLAETVDDLHAAYVRQADAQDCIEHNTANVSFLEDQLLSLQRKRASRQREKDKLDTEIATMEQKIDLAVIAGPGLCIRSLEKSVLTHVLSYLNPTGGINMVCKYWAQLAAELRQTSTASALTQTGSGKVLKRSKSEIKTALAQIKSGVVLREIARQQVTQRRLGDSAEGLPSQPGSPSREVSGGRGASTGNGTTTPAMSAASLGSNVAQAGPTSGQSTVGDSNAAVFQGICVVSVLVAGTYAGFLLYRE